MIYLDNAATSLTKTKAVKQAVEYAINNLTANAGRSGHIQAQKCAQVVFNARQAIKKIFNAKNYQVIFTKNCTEALNLAIFGSLTAGDHVITTCYEHNSVLRPLEHLKNGGVEITILTCPLNEVENETEKHIKPNTKMIITTGTSNVNGEICNIEAVGEICNKHNLFYLIDGAQCSGHRNIDLSKTNATMYAFAGHKGLGAITGVGGLIVKNGTKLNPFMFGGTGTESENLNQPTDLPEGLEAGTLPTISIASLLVAVEEITQNFNTIIKEENQLTNYLINQLKQLNFINLYSNQNCENVVAFNVLNLDSSFVANQLNEQFNICVRSGLHCAPLIHKKLGTTVQGAVRVSVNYHNTKDEIDTLIFALKTIYKQITS